jgi:hypothetical protein
MFGNIARCDHDVLANTAFRVRRTAACFDVCAEANYCSNRAARSGIAALAARRKHAPDADASRDSPG